MADLQVLQQKLAERLQMQGPVNEGKDGSHGDVFGSGDTYESTTWPKGVEIVPSAGAEGEGIIRVPYDCMVRHKHYIGQVETATSDDQHPAVVVAKYAFTLSGRVSIFDIQTEGGPSRRCADSIRQRLQSVNGQVL